MADPKIDKAKAAKDRFINGLDKLKTADEFLEFTISFFYNQSEQENMMNIIGLAAMANVDLPRWKPFIGYYKTVAYREFALKIRRQFITEEARIGLML